MCNWIKTEWVNERENPVKECSLEHLVDNAYLFALHFAGPMIGLLIADCPARIGLAMEEENSVNIYCINLHRTKLLYSENTTMYLPIWAACLVEFTLRCISSFIRLDSVWYLERSLSDTRSRCSRVCIWSSRIWTFFSSFGFSRSNSEWADTS